MKKILKTIISSICTLAVSASSALSVSAEYDSTGAFYYKTITPCKYDLNNLNHIAISADEAIDVSSNEFKEFLKGAKRFDNNGYPESTDYYYYIAYSIAGKNNKGDIIITDNFCCKLQGFDENNIPIIIQSEDAVIPAISKMYGVFESRVLNSGVYQLLIRIDKSGEIECVNINNLGDDIYKTKDLYTGEDIVIKSNDGISYTVISKGDSTLDGNVDVRDVAKYAQHIVKLDKIPDYADLVADIDADGIIGVKDLVSLKSYLIGNSF